MAQLVGHFADSGYAGLKSGDFVSHGTDEDVAGGLSCLERC
jgi:hypothetical protein